MYIRALQQGEQAAVLGLMNEHTLQFPDFVKARYPERWDRFLNHGDACDCGYFVYVNEAREVLGHTGFLYNKEVQLYEIVGVVVKKGSQRLGIGKQLLDDICTRIASLGAEQVILYTLDHADSQAALHFYRDIGFAVARHEADYFHPGFHRVTFAKELLAIT